MENDEKLNIYSSFIYKLEEKIFFNAIPKIY